jgi:Mn-dependent DtxR family transcriptional regulator
VSVIVESHVEEIVSFLTNKGEATTAEIADAIGLKPSSTRELLDVIDEVEAISSNKDRRYTLKNK